MNTTHRYFDLIDFTRKIPEAFIAAQVAQSVAWRMDTLITSKTRQVLREVREAAVLRGDAERYNETADMLRSLNVADEWFKATGLDRGVHDELVRLSALREVMHDTAAELTALVFDWQGRPRQYDKPDLEDVFRAAPNTRVSSTVKQRVELTSKALADAFGLDAQVLRERRLAAQQRQAQDRAEAVLETADIAWWCYTEILRNQPDELEAQKRGDTVLTQTDAKEQGFSHLSEETQLALIQGARQAAERAMSFAESDRNLTDSEFTRILACAMKVSKDLDSVLRAPKFSTV